jgi:copper oxidase (laccase) domain-containing protein
MKKAKPHMHPPLEQSPALTQITGIRHGFFGRRGGVSDGEFASLNASRMVGDDTANVVENVRNRSGAAGTRHRRSHSGQGL